MIGTASFVGAGIMIAGGIVLPVGTCIWWLKTRKDRLSTVLAGAATWFLFAMILESVPKLLLFNPSTSIGKTVIDNVALYTVFGALLAGVFEETGRLVAFKTVLRNRTNKETGISHGIGHGGFEAMFLMGVSGVQFMVFAVMINNGTFQTLIDQAAAGGADISGLEALPAELMKITPLIGALNIFERAVSMLLHVGLSVLVFNAVKRSKISLYFIAVAAHTLIDVPAALYQKDVLNIYVVEALFAVVSVAFFVTVYRTFYKDEEPGEEGGEDRNDLP